MGFRVASVQADVVYGDTGANFDFLEREVAKLVQAGVQLAVFPECFLTGYCVSTREEAEAIALSLDHPVLAQVKALSKDISILVGFAEIDEIRTPSPTPVGEGAGGGVIRNSALLTGPGIDIVYRKTHLPELGLDKLVVPGDSLGVHQVGEARVGPLICYDMRPPEATRTLALQGAEIIALPTNWPEGAETSAEIICRARAAENRVFMITCDRVGVENGFRFIGRSKIIGVNGEIIAEAQDHPVTLIADLDLEQARQKRTVNIPGIYELDLFGSRRPELYKPITG